VLLSDTPGVKKAVILTNEIKEKTMTKKQLLEFDTLSPETLNVQKNKIIARSGNDRRALPIDRRGLTENRIDRVNEEKAKIQLNNAIHENYGLLDTSMYVHWINEENEAILNGEFTADQLEAIAWWMRNKGKK